MHSQRLSRRALALVIFGTTVLMSVSACKREAAEVRRSEAAGGPAEAVPAVPSEVVVDAADLAVETGEPLRVTFGDRGRGVAYVALRERGIHVVFNGRAGRPVGGVDQVLISPDGTRLAYSAEVDGVWRMVVDGELEVQSTSVGDPAFSGDGRHLAYSASTPEGHRLVVDGVAGAPRHEISGRPAFNSDASLVAFVEVLADGGPKRLVVSDLARNRQRVLREHVVRFQPDGSGARLVSVVEDGDGQRLVVSPFALAGESTASARYDAISAVAFDGAGSRIAFLAERGGERVAVIGGEERVLPFDEASELAIGEHGRWAVAARRGEAWFVVVDGKEGPAFDRVVTPVISPDGARVVYRARKGGARFVVVADAAGKTLRQHPPYEQVFPVILSADGTSMTYGVKDGAKLTWKVEPLGP